MRRAGVLFLVCMCICLVSINCLAAGVTIQRDTYGVPHIYAETLDGLYYGWGYATAQDRLFQLEMLIRTYYGQVSELFGEKFVQLDYYWKNEFPTAQELQVFLDKMDPKYKAILKAYTAGVNAWIDETLKDPNKKLPFEYHRLGIKPRHLTEVDMAAAIMSTLGVFMDLNNESLHTEVYTYLQSTFGDKARDYFDDMAWFNDESAYTTIAKADQIGPVSISKYTPYSQLDKLNPVGLARFTKSYEENDHLIASLLADLGLAAPEKIKQGAREAASYCVVVSPEKSATGHALLMAGPQLDFYLPGLIYETGLHLTGGFDVVGSSIFGAPYILFGETNTTAFSSTAGVDNIVDIYEEKLNPDNPTQYWFKGQWYDMEVRTDQIQVRGQAPKKITLYRTVHGPVISQLDTNNDGKIDVAYSKKTACYDSYLSAVGSYTELMLAQTPEQFKKAGATLEPCLNYFWADNQGNIAYYHAGKFPVRPEGIDPRFPTPGTGEYEWQGFLTPEEHPQVVNPSTGVIINWNNKPTPYFDNGDLNSIFTWGCWSEDHRSKNLVRLVNEKLPLSIQDMKDIIHEIADTQLEAVAVKGFLLEALQDVTDPKLVEARKIFNSWDNLRTDANHDGFYDTPANALFMEWWQVVNRNAFADEFGPYFESNYNFGGLLDNYGGYSFFVRTLLGDKATVPVKNDYYNGKGWKNVFIESLQQAMDNLTQQYGTADISQWKKSIKMMSFLPTDIMGAPTTFNMLPMVKYMDRGSQNHIVDLTQPVVTGINICPPGQSGFINKQGQPSKHFSDQLDMYANWQYKDMLIKRGDVLSNLESTQILIYNPKK